MPLNLDKLFGINEQALKVHSRRSEVLAGNIANADTPGYKARDIDFKETLKSLAAGDQRQLQTTHTRHFTSTGNLASRVDDVLTELKFRNPTQPSLDGNTVDPLKEKAAFMENALLYQTNLKFLNSKIKSIKSALQGE